MFTFFNHSIKTDLQLKAEAAGSAWVDVVVLLLCGKVNWQGASVT